MQRDLFPAPIPPAFEGITLERCDVAKVLPRVRGARLVHADPPWTYQDARCNGAAAKHYDLITLEQIGEHIDAAFDSAAADAYLLCWSTWPKLMEFAPIALSTRWHFVTGASWHKTEGIGIGYHFRGDSEPLLLARKGKPKPVGGAISNAFACRRGSHSEKPVLWLEALVDSFTEPGDLVLDLYAGLAPMARACAAVRRRYHGAEIDEDRHRAALGALALDRWRR